jgi:glutathione S-transferase
MKLYFAPGACSHAVHLCLREANATFDVVKVDLRTKKTADGGDFTEVNPKGYVPTLVLDSGEKLTEVSAILQYVADTFPAANLAPAAGSFAKYQWLEWLGYINSELHKSMGALFHTDEAGRPAAVARLEKQLKYVEGALEGRTWLVGDHFTAVDAYLFVIASWSKWVKYDLSPYKNITAFVARVADRPSVATARAAER